MIVVSKSILSCLINKENASPVVAGMLYVISDQQDGSPEIMERKDDVGLTVPDRCII
jgi:hypothetical protein